VTTFVGSPSSRTLRSAAATDQFNRLNQSRRPVRDKLSLRTRPRDAAPRVPTTSRSNGPERTGTGSQERILDFISRRLRDPAQSAWDLTTPRTMSGNLTTSVEGNCSPLRLALLAVDDRIDLVDAGDRDSLPLFEGKRMRRYVKRQGGPFARGPKHDVDGVAFQRRIARD
jgi:hypothetical protein